MQYTAQENLSLQLHLMGLNAYTSVSDSKYLLSGGDKALLCSACLTSAKPLVGFIALQESIVVVHSCNLHTWKVEAGGSEVQCHSLLQNNLKVSLECVQPCLKAQTELNSIVSCKLLKPQFHSLMEDSNIVFNNEFVKN